MPNPCPPHVITDAYGPFRIGFTVELPLGYVDRMISWDGNDMVQSSELHHTLTTAWDQLPPELSVSLGGRPTETVWCGTDPLVFNGSPLHREPTEGPPDTDSWVVQVWVYAPNAPTSAWLDYPYIARMWASGLGEFFLPGKSFPARLTITDVAYLVNNSFTALLPQDYAPPQADPLI